MARKNARLQRVSEDEFQVSENITLLAYVVKQKTLRGPRLEAYKGGLIVSIKNNGQIFCERAQGTRTYQAVFNS